MGKRKQIINGNITPRTSLHYIERMVTTQRSSLHYINLITLHWDLLYTKPGSSLHYINFTTLQRSSLHYINFTTLQRDLHYITLASLHYRKGNLSTKEQLSRSNLCHHFTRNVAWRSHRSNQCWQYMSPEILPDFPWNSSTSSPLLDYLHTTST